MRTPIEIYMVFDLETTGLVAGKHAICEIACCPFDQNLNNLKEFESGIIKPYDNREIQQNALNHNGITYSQLENGRDSEVVFDELVKYIKSFKKTAAKIILVGHNILKFDNRHLEDYFNFHGKDLWKFVNSNIGLDTMWWSRMERVESDNFKLGTSCANRGIDLVDAHRAVNDTRANRDLAKSYLRGLRGESSNIQNEVGKDIKRPIFQF